MIHYPSWYIESKICLNPTIIKQDNATLIPWEGEFISFPKMKIVPCGMCPNCTFKKRNMQRKRRRKK